MGPQIFSRELNFFLFLYNFFLLFWLLVFRRVVVTVRKGGLWVHLGVPRGGSDEIDFSVNRLVDIHDV